MQLIFSLMLLLAVASCGSPAEDGVKQKSLGNSSDHGTQSQAVEKSSSQLVFEPGELNLGSVKEGDKAVGYIRIRNAGKTMEQIVEMTTSCGCSVAEPEQRLLAAGAFTRARITIDTFAKQDEVKKWVELTDGRGRRSRATIYLNITENPHLEVKGRSIFSGQCAACHFDPAKGKVSGENIFKAVCSMCHGAKAEGAYAPALRGRGDARLLAAQIARGSGSQHMPGFSIAHGGPLDERQIAAITQWLLRLDE